ncbi:MAG TPA: 3-phosphoshikimate 1-carboxyvinyltransferase [Chthonomonadales bacterium]|nr:3-phosphoshikimate 1-carboxyvinyltransferase [Chthonomonadales bacterium]
MNDSLLIQPLTRPVNAILTLPGSKSITNRALLLAALAEGTSRIENALFSDDTRYMAESLQRLGIDVRANEADAYFEVDGTGGHIPAQEADLFIGNAGTAARFLTAFLTLGQGRFRLDGVPRMRARPIGDLLDALVQLGANVHAEFDNGCPPLRIEASRLPGGTARLRADVSSQYLSALLMIAPLTPNGIEITLDGELASRPYVDMTLRMMHDRGVRTERIGYRSFRVPGGQQYHPQLYRVEPDASAASYFFAAAAITGGRVRVEGLGLASIQGDTAFVDILEKMGCTVRKSPDFIEVQGPETLRGVDVDMNAISDTVMTLAAIAPFASDPTVIRNVAHIRHKETDRLAALAKELTRLGVEVEESPDGLAIQPMKHLRPAVIETYDDHRMAMSFAITGLRAPGIAIQNPGCVAKTLPDFFQRLEALRETARQGGRA